MFALPLVLRIGTSGPASEDLVVVGSSPLLAPAIAPSDGAIALLEEGFGLRVFEPFGVDYPLGSGANPTWSPDGANVAFDDGGPFGGVTALVSDSASGTWSRTPAAIAIRAGRAGVGPFGACRDGVDNDGDGAIDVSA